MGAMFSRQFGFRTLNLRATGGKREADIMVAVFDKLDTDVAVGNTERQVVDPGSFRGIIDDGTLDRRQFLLDHGDAHLLGGYIDSSKLIGWSDAFREDKADGDEGLIFTGHYLEGVGVADHAYAAVSQMPDLVRYSFRWPATETIEKVDGVPHVTAFTDVEEVTQTSIGAQAEARTLGVRTAIGAHGGATSTGSWDGPANEANLSTDAGGATYKKAFAWVDPDGDADTKAAYRFIHHEVADDGTVGAANITACRTGIGVLNGGRGGTTIPDDDKQGVYNHLAGHLRDADLEPPELRAPAMGDVFGPVLSAVTLASGLRSIALEQLVEGVRQSWWAAHPANGPMEIGSWVVEVYADDDTLTRGAVIVQEAEDFRRVPWEQTDDGFAFDESAATDVHREWAAGAGTRTSGLLGDLFRPHIRHTYHGEKKPAKPTVTLLKEWLKEDAFADRLKKAIADDERFAGAGGNDLEVMLKHAVEDDPATADTYRTAIADVLDRAASDAALVAAFGGRASGADAEYARYAELFGEQAPA